MSLNFQLYDLLFPFVVSRYYSGIFGQPLVRLSCPVVKSICQRIRKTNSS